MASTSSYLSNRFDTLLKAMLTRPPSDPDGGKKSKAGPASGEATSADSAGTRTPKGTSGATSSKR